MHSWSVALLKVQIVEVLVRFDQHANWFIGWQQEFGHLNLTYVCILLGNLWLLILIHSFFRDVFIFLTVYNSFYLLCVLCVFKLLSRVQLVATPWAVAHQYPLSMEFSRQEYWSRLPFPSPGDPPDPGIEPMSPALQADSLLSEP